jgi:hypothetical protein
LGVDAQALEEALGDGLYAHMLGPDPELVRMALSVSNIFSGSEGSWE